MEFVSTLHIRLKYTDIRKFLDSLKLNYDEQTKFCFGWKLLTALKTVYSFCKYPNSGSSIQILICEV